MIVHQIYENESIEVTNDIGKIAALMKAKNPNLPFYVEDNIKINFDSYIVGSIQVLDKVINILPRNPALTLKSIFEMILFNNNIIMNDSTVGYNFIDSNGVSVVPLYFYNSCKKLIDFGLTGGYKEEYKVSKTLQGELLLEKFNKKNIQLEGLHYIKQSYELDITPNQIIKSALLKIIKSKQIGNDNLQKFILLLREFNNVSEFVGNVYDYKENRYYSSNPYYAEAIELSIVILKEIKLSFSNGNIQWYSFLQNSNNLFESYIRNMVSKLVDLKVEKWDFAKKFASIKYKDRQVFKSYIPDILIGYNNITESCKIVIDVKNKKFNPLIGNLTEVVESADIYQILFYCRQLKTKLGGLIYPAGEDFEPVDLIINYDGDYRIVLFSVNMNESYRKRSFKLKSELENKLLKYL